MADMAQSTPAEAFAISFPRKATISMAVSGEITSAQARAEYSPRERPAAKSGRMPISFRIAVTPQAKATIAGCV